MQTNVLIMRNKYEYENLSGKKLHEAHFACYGEGNHFVIVKDRLSNIDRIGTCVTPAMLSNILAQA